MAKKFLYNFFVLGENIEMEFDENDNSDIFNIANMISLINILGKPYYEELQKQGVIIEDEIDEIVKRKLY